MPQSRLLNPSRWTSSAVAVFARAPVPGRAKTRLIPLLGPQGAAQLQGALLADTLRKLSFSSSVSRYLFQAGSFAASPPPHVVVARQRGADLGGRLAHAFRAMLPHHSRVVVIGTDSPLLRPKILRQAIDELQICDAVLGPCPDGGFYLLGLRRIARGLFRGVRWGGASAFQDMLRNFLEAGYACSVIEPCADVDVSEDVYQLRRKLKRSPALRRLAPQTWRYLQQVLP